MKTFFLKAVALLAVVWLVQFAFSVRFDQDELERIICTMIGAGGIEAIASRRKD